MLNRRSVAYRYTLFASVLVIAVGGGYLGYRWLFPTTVSANLLGNAETAYRSGASALDAKDANGALAKFDEANLLVGKALESLDTEIKQNRSPNPPLMNQWSEERGQILWLRARILRDTEFARALADGKPIPDTEDSSTREKFRSVARIPNPDSLREAIACLREAASRLPRNVTIQKELLRFETLVEPFPWAVVERLSRNIIETETDNVRARYFLARIEHDQFQEGTALPTPFAKRSRERIEAARDHLLAAKEATYYPLWRFLYLEAEITKWLARDPGSSRQKVKQEETRFRELLFDPKTGALARAARSEAFEPLTRFDLEGLLGLHQMAMDYRVEELRSGKSTSNEALLTTLDAMLATAARLAPNVYVAPYRGDLLDVCARATYRTRRFLGAETPGGWAERRDQLVQLSRKSLDDKIVCATGYADLARLLNQDGYLEGKRGNVPAQQRLEKQAIGLVDEAIQVADAQKAMPDQLLQLHVAALELLTAQGGKPELLAPHHAALKKMNQPEARGVVAFEEATAAARQGRLLKAFALTQDVLGNPEAKDYRIRALMMAANLGLAIRQPAQAANALRELEKSYARFNELSPAERDWAREFLRDPQELAVLSVVAQLEIALQKILADQLASPARPIPPLTYEGYEEEAQRSLAKLPVGTDGNRQARTAFVNYYLNSGRRAKAVEQLKTLSKDYPANVEVLRLETTLAILVDPTVKEPPSDADRRKSADALIRGFIQRNPTDVTGRRFWAEWLLRTNRADEAIAYLESRSNFPDEKDDITKRTLAVALINAGQQAQGLKLLGQLPKSATLEAAMMRLSAETTAPNQQLLQEAITRYESNGLFRVWEGERLLSEGKFAAAAKIFRQATEYTKFRSAAQIGLLRAMLALGQTDPAKAIELVDAFAVETPDDGMLYSVGAWSALQRDDIGTPTDTWDKAKTMTGGLNRWQLAARKGNLDAKSQALFRAQFWMLASRNDLAWFEVEPLAASRPIQEDLFVFLISLAIETRDVDWLAKSGGYVATFKQLRPLSKPVALLEARWLAASGETDEAIKNALALLNTDPTFVDGYPFLVMWLNEAKRTPEAVEWTAKWRKQVPDDLLVQMEELRQTLAAGKTDDAKKLADNFVDSHVAKLEKSINKNKSDAPDAEKRKQERLEESRRAAWLMLGQVGYDSGKYDFAEPYLEKLVREQPKNIAVKLLRGQIALAKKDWAAARKIYEEAIKEEPDNFVAVNNLAWVMAEHLDVPTEALALIRPGMKGTLSGKPLPVERLNPEFLHTLGVVFGQAARKGTDAALYGEMLRIFDTACRRYPSDARMFLHRGDAHAGLKEMEEAKQSWQKAQLLAKEGKGAISTDQREELIRKSTDRLKGR